MAMIHKILPPVIEDNYRGHGIALLVFYLITVATIFRSCIHIFKTDGGAQSIATIPLDSFTNGGAEAVVFLFAYWGLSQLMFGLIQGVVALRYKSLIPLIYLFLLFEYVGRFGIAFFKSIETTGPAPGGVTNYVFPILFVIMFFLSVREKKVIS